MPVKSAAAISLGYPAPVDAFASNFPDTLARCIRPALRPPVDCWHSSGVFFCPWHAQVHQAHNRQCRVSCKCLLTARCSCLSSGSWCQRCRGCPPLQKCTLPRSSSGNSHWNMLESATSRAKPVGSTQKTHAKWAHCRPAQPPFADTPSPYLSISVRHCQFAADRSSGRQLAETICLRHQFLWFTAAVKWLRSSAAGAFGTSRSFEGGIRTAAMCRQHGGNVPHRRLHPASSQR